MWIIFFGSHPYRVRVTTVLVRLINSWYFPHIFNDISQFKTAVLILFLLYIYSWINKWRMPKRLELCGHLRPVHLIESGAQSHYYRFFATSSYMTHPLCFRSHKHHAAQSNHRCSHCHSSATSILSLLGWICVVICVSSVWTNEVRPIWTWARLFSHVVISRVTMRHWNTTSQCEL